MHARQPVEAAMKGPILVALIGSNAGIASLHKIDIIA
jgi:hypothetical protein